MKVYDSAGRVKGFVSSNPQDAVSVFAQGRGFISRHGKWNSYNDETEFI